MKVEIIELPETEVTADDGLKFDAGEMGKNIIPSAVQLGKDIAYPFMHPIETAQGLKALGTGIYELTQKELGNREGMEDTTDMAAAGAVWDYLKERYGGAQNILTTLQNDPVGLLTDASAILTGGGSIVAKTPSIFGKVGDIAVKTGKIIDPILQAQKGTQAIIPPILQGLSGVDAAAYSQSIKAGKEGYTPFLENINKKITPEESVSKLKKGVKELRKQTSESFGISKKDWDTMADVDFLPIQDKLNALKLDTRLGGKARGKTYLDRSETKKLNDLGKIIDKYISGKDPNLRTVEGANFLKREIDKKYKTLTPDQSDAKRIYSEIKSDLIDQIDIADANYKPTLQAYGTAMETIKDIEKSLSAGDKAQVDTGINKILSVSKNIGTREHRLNLMDYLKEKTGIDLASESAGMALSDPFSKKQFQLLSSSGIGAAPLIAGSGFSIPLAALGFGTTSLLGSPRLMGNIGYGLGSAQRIPVAGNLFTQKGINRAAYGGSVVDELTQAPFEGLLSIDEIKEKYQ